MERCIAHRNTANKDGFESRYWGNSACSTHLKFHIQKPGHFFLRGKFSRNRPARSLSHKAESILKLEAINLVDDAVNVVGKLISLLNHTLIVIFTSSNTRQRLNKGVYFEPPSSQSLQHTLMSFRFYVRLILPHTIGAHL